MGEEEGGKREAQKMNSLRPFTDARLMETSDPKRFELIITVEEDREGKRAVWSGGTIRKEETYCILEVREAEPKPFEIWIYYMHTVTFKRENVKHNWGRPSEPIEYRLSREMRQMIYAAGMEAYWRHFFGTGMDVMRSIGYWGDELKKRDREAKVSSANTGPPFIVQ